MNGFIVIAILLGKLIHTVLASKLTSIGFHTIFLLCYHIVALDCYRIGKQAYQQNSWSKVSGWMKEALNRSDDGKN